MRVPESILPAGISAEKKERLTAIVKDWGSIWKVKVLNSEARVGSILGIDPQYYPLLNTLSIEDLTYLLDSCPSAGEALAAHSRVSAEIESMFPGQAADIAKYIGRAATTFFCDDDLLTIRYATTQKQRLDKVAKFNQQVQALNTRSHGMLGIFPPTGTDTVSTPLTETVASLLEDSTFNTINTTDYEDRLTATEKLLYDTATQQLDKTLSSMPGFRRSEDVQALYEAIRDQYATQFGTKAATEAKEADVTHTAAP